MHAPIIHASNHKIKEEVTSNRHDEAGNVTDFKQGVSVTIGERRRLGKTKTKDGEQDR